jgi:hypothetical protein
MRRDIIQLPYSSSGRGTKGVVVAVALCTCIREVLISNLDRGTEFTDWSFHGFLQSLQANGAGIVQSVWMAEGSEFESR